MLQDVMCTQVHCSTGPMVRCGFGLQFGWTWVVTDPLPLCCAASCCSILTRAQAGLMSPRVVGGDTTKLGSTRAPKESPELTMELHHC